MVCKLKRNGRNLGACTATNVSRRRGSTMAKNIAHCCVAFVSKVGLKRCSIRIGAVSEYIAQDIYTDSVISPIAE